MTTSRSDSRKPQAAAVRHIVGVDGGGSGTRARLQDCTGRTLGQGTAGPSALSQGVAQAWRHVQQAVAAAFAEAGLAPVLPAEIAIGLGLAGAGVAAQHAAFLQADPGYARCLLVNDGLTQLQGAHADRAGVVVAAGTGSVAMARDAAGRTRQSGGWGFPVGDEGSGAWLGLRAMQQAQAVLDGRAARGPLAQAVFDQVGADAQALLAWCAAAGPAAYAQLAPLVLDAAAAGDGPARALLQAAADELARLVNALQAGQPAALPLVVCGSIGERVAHLWPAELQARVVPAQGDSADGALQLVRAWLAVAA